MPVHDPAKLVQETLVPLNENSCNFILHVAPNRNGLIDANALAGLKEIGKLWKKLGPHHAAYAAQAPTIASNLANNQAANSSWSNDDDDHTS